MFNLSRLVPSKTFGIQNLATKDIRFVAGIRLAASFSRVLARRFINSGRIVTTRGNCLLV